MVKDGEEVKDNSVEAAEASELEEVAESAGEETPRPAPDPRVLPKKLKALLGIRPRVLVVDDVEDNRDVAVQSLGRGFEITEAEDGEEGLKKAEEVRPDLILLDVMMPKMDGVEALTRLREHPQLKATPIIMLTAVAEKQRVLEILHQGVQDYIVKPFEPATIRDKVSKVLGDAWQLPFKGSGETPVKPSFRLSRKVGVQILKFLDKGAQWRMKELAQILLWLSEQGSAKFILNMGEVGNLDLGNTSVLANTCTQLKRQGVNLAVVHPEAERLQSQIGQGGEGRGVIKVMDDFDEAMELFEAGILG